MLVGRPFRPARHPVRVNVAGRARGTYIRLGKEVGVHIDKLLVGVGNAHDDRLARSRAAARKYAEFKERAICKTSHAAVLKRHGCCSLRLRSGPLGRQFDSAAQNGRQRRASARRFVRVALTASISAEVLMFTPPPLMWRSAARHPCSLARCDDGNRMRAYLARCECSYDQ